MTIEFLYRMNQWVILGASLALFLLAIEAGFRLGRRNRLTIGEHAKSQINTIQGAILGLLALLLGFTFAMAISRFEVRKQLVLDEANAIGTTFLRAQLLTEPQRQEVSNLLRQYVEVRLKSYKAGVDPERFREAQKQTEQLHLLLWSSAIALGEKDPRAVTTGLFIQSLNEVIDLYSKRLTALENHVPEIILVLLCCVALAANGLIGYGCGLGERRNFFVTLTASMLIAFVILVIVDLDRPRRGLIRVSQERMLDLHHSLESIYRGVGITSPGHK
jgi:hypothetical protein